jgi:hypothetical protein
MAEEKAGGGGVLEVLTEEAKKYWHVILIGIIIFIAAKNDSFAFFLYKIFLTILPLLGVVGLGMLAWKLWVHYVQQDFISGIEFVLLEIVPPREVLRSPRAMELFFTNALYHWSMKGGLEAYWQGAVWFWFSLEIVSIDGQRLCEKAVSVPARDGIAEVSRYSEDHLELATLDWFMISKTFIVLFD